MSALLTSVRRTTLEGARALRPLPAALALLLGAAFLPARLEAQTANLLMNGDFELGSTTGWTQTGGPTGSVQSFDVTGLGATLAFGANVGQTHLGLSQQVTLVAGLQYLLRADFAGDHPYSHSNSDGGQWEVRVGGTLVASGSLGGINGFQTLRQHIVAPFTVTQTGPTAVEVQMFRQYLASGVRTWFDNVELIFTALPIVGIRDARSVGTTVGVTVTGTPSAQYGVFVSPGKAPVPLPLPGFLGQLQLDPGVIVLVQSGTIDSRGTATFPLPLPNLPFLVGLPLWFQGLQVATQPSLGSLHYYPLIP